MLRLWIAQGAIWPKDISLKTASRSRSRGNPSPDDMELVRKIHAHDRGASRRPSPHAEPADYSAKIPQTGVAYHMVALKGGEFSMGSPDSEAGRQDIEGPQKRVKVSPFWIGKYEVTWDEYEPFMITRVERFKNGARKDFDPAQAHDVDAVSGPTAPYADMSFGMGRLGYPGHLHDAACGQQVLPVAERPDGPFLSASDRGGVGIRLPGRHNHGLLVRRRPGETRRIRLVHRQQRGEVPKGRPKEAQPLGALRHARQRDGMDGRPVRAGLLRPARKRRPPIRSSGRKRFIPAASAAAAGTTIPSSCVRRSAAARSHVGSSRIRSCPRAFGT